MQFQQIETQKAEIEFRRKLIQHQVDDQRLFDDEFDSQAIENILRERMRKTEERMRLLFRDGLTLSPYVEIGAERGQRSLVMENDLDSCGAALDLSFDMLRSCGHYSKVFNKPKLPIRICCDLYNIPFASNSVPFVFCYGTLHHFPNPTPIIREVFRVLQPGGILFFDEEPFKRVLYLPLYDASKSYSEKTLKRSLLKKVLDHFFAKRSCNEIEFGIIENDEISLSTWKDALSIFDQRETQLLAMNGILRSSLFRPRNFAAFLLAYALGGSISGIARKGGSVDAKEKSSVVDLLICPTCSSGTDEELLTMKNSAFVCVTCEKSYPTKDGVVFLLNHDKLKKLFPVVYEECVASQ